MSDTQLIKDKLDIVDFIGEYVQLKPAGINHKGCCPFHKEKTPSFMASRERQSWHCFGCGKGGDVFSFAQEIEGMEFVEALKFLAARAGVPLVDNRRSEVESNQKNRIKEINAEAARFFHNFLIKMPGSEMARDYIKNKRGLTDETIDDWQVGFVPEQWELLTQYLLKKGKSIDDLVASGLTIKRDPGSASGATPGRVSFYDRFRGRVMFPIWDVHGSVVGFTGRVLVETEHSGGKYVNTPQTIVYDKSRVVFGLNKAKQEIKAKDLIVMVEGHMDVVACHAVGMKNVVATSGTALTAEQVQLLKRYSNNIAIAFDADAAGQNAAKRGIDIALEIGMNVKVITIPEGKGKDADECLKKNPDVWFAAVTNAKDIMVWYLDKAFANRTVLGPKEKQQIANEVLAEIRRIPFAVEKDHWLRDLGGRLGVDVTILREDMQRIQGMIKEKRPEVEKAEMKSNKPVSIAETRQELLVGRLFSLFLRFPTLMSLAVLTSLEGFLSTSRYLPLYETLKLLYTQISLVTVDALRDHLKQHNLEGELDLLLMKAELDFSGFGDRESKEELRAIVTKIKDDQNKGRRAELMIQIQQAEKEGDAGKVNELLKIIQGV